MALCNDPEFMKKLVLDDFQSWERDAMFKELHESHAMSWDRGPTKEREDYRQFHNWKMAWWRELERAFPDKIKNGVVTCWTTERVQRTAPSTSPPASKSRGSRSFPAVYLSSSGLSPEAIPCMQQSVDPGTFQEVTKVSGQTCSLTSKPISKVSANPGKSAL